VGKLYRGVLTIRPQCKVCGLALAGLATEDGPAFFIIMGFSGLLLPMVVAVEFFFAPPIWVHIIVWVPVTLAGTIGLLRPAKAIMITQAYRHLTPANGSSPTRGGGGANNANSGKSDN
jgi:uncharacterized protein (DUF983 family)